MTLISLLTVRLVGVDNVHGRLEVQRNGTWQTMCGDFFDDAAARVVCHMLGHGYINCIKFDMSVSMFI